MARVRRERKVARKTKERIKRGRKGKERKGKEKETRYVEAYPTVCVL